MRMRSPLAQFSGEQEFFETAGPLSPVTGMSIQSEMRKGCVWGVCVGEGGKGDVNAVKNVKLWVL